MAKPRLMRKAAKARLALIQIEVLQLEMRLFHLSSLPHAPRT
jgi:hypothetical protein